MNYFLIIIIFLVSPLKAMEKPSQIHIERKKTVNYSVEPIAVVDNVEEIPNFKIDTRINSPEYGPRLGLKTHKETLKKRDSVTFIYPKKSYLGSPIEVIDAINPKKNNTSTTKKTSKKIIKKNDRTENSSVTPLRLSKVSMKKKRQTRKQAERKLTSAALLHEKLRNFIETLPSNAMIKDSSIILKFLLQNQNKINALSDEEVGSLLNIKNSVGFTLFDYAILYNENVAQKFLVDLLPCNKMLIIRHANYP